LLATSQHSYIGTILTHKEIKTQVLMPTAPPHHNKYPLHGRPPPISMAAN
jgi:hypothetical protein